MNLQPPAPPASWAGQLGMGLLRHAGLGLLAVTAALALLSVASFRLRCESFGCLHAVASQRGKTQTFKIKCLTRLWSGFAF